MRVRPYKPVTSGNKLAIKLGGVSSKPSPSSAPKRPVAAVFGNDSDSDEEEMPEEARMRMRNVGRETPTSAGPNSFGKTKQGFTDMGALYERNLKKAMEEAAKES